MSALFGLLPLGINHYTVRRADTLRTISKHFYGTEDHWAIIFRYNKLFIADPNQLSPGQIIVIPHVNHHDC